MDSAARKPRIVYFQQNLAVGATEEYLYLLMEGIDRTQFDLVFVCPQDAVLDSLITRLERLGVTIYRYSLGGDSLRIVLRLRAVFRQVRPAIIHFNDPCLLGVVAARLAGIQVLVMTHHTPELNRKYNWKARFVERMAFKHFGLYTIFTSEHDRDTGIEADKISTSRSAVIYYGLPAGTFAQKYDRQQICDEFSLGRDCRIIGNVARLSPQKGQQYLLEAAPRVLQKCESARFFFVGEGELEAELRTRVKAMGLENYFVFTGYRTDIPRLLSAFEVLVMPSLFEGLCFAAIEAQAMGVPVVASRVGGLRRSVTDGKTGLLVPPADTKALADGILWMLEHREEARHMGRAGQRHFAECFTQEQMVKKTEALYQNMLNS